MGQKINLNTRLGEVGDTRALQADGHIDITQGKGFRLSAGSVAAAGTTTSDATQTGYGHTLVTTAGANSGVRFESFTAGEVRGVKNIGANSVKVYPPTGGTIDNSAPNGSISLASGIGALFFATADNTVVRGS